MRSMKLQEIPSNGSQDTALKVLCSLSKVLFIGDLSQPNCVCVDSGVTLHRNLRYSWKGI